MEIDLSGAASAMIDGLVDGITSGASAVISAVTNLAAGAVSAVESALGISSPSKVLAGVGGDTADGFVEGVDDGAAGAQASLTAMVDPTDAAAGGAPRGGRAGASGGGPVTFNFYGVKDAEAGRAMFVDAYRDFLEGGLTPSPA